ncbi:MAG: heme exporter protein CcmD [Tahibacter sp.]
MNEFFSMGGYAGYVWSAYAIFLGLLLIDTIAPMLRRQRILAELRGRIRRERARGANTP